MVKNNGNHTSRIEEEFNKQLEEIKKARIDNGLDKTEKSTRILTDLIVKHNSWESIKHELIGYNFGVENEK